MTQVSRTAVSTISATGISVFQRRTTGVKTAADQAIYTPSRTTPSGGFTYGQYANLMLALHHLEHRVSALEAAAIEVIDELPWEDALDKARVLFDSSKGCLYPTDVADALGTSYSQAIDLCEALEREGAVVVAETGTKEA